jgi:hypothetical protein
VAGSNEHGRLTDVVKEEVKPDLDVPEGEAPF